MPSEPTSRAYVINEVVDDRIVRADALYPGCVFLVRSTISQVNMLRVAHGDSASSDVGDVVAGNVGIDDVVDHRNSFIATVFHDIANEIDGVGAVDVDHRRQCIGDLVFAVVPVAVAIGDVNGGTLYRRLAA